MIFALKEWSGHSGFRFYEVLNTVRTDLGYVRPTLVILARVGHRKRIVYQLNDRFTENRTLIYITVMNETGENIGCDVTFEENVRKRFHTKGSDQISATEYQKMRPNGETEK